jgi:hypothetical protein
MSQQDVKILVESLKIQEIFEYNDCLINESNDIDGKAKTTLKLLGYSAIGAAAVGGGAAAGVYARFNHPIDRMFGLSSKISEMAGKGTAIVAFPLIAVSYLIYKLYSNINKSQKNEDQLSKQIDRLEKKISEKEQLINSGKLSGTKLENAKEDVKGAKEYLSKMK